MQRHAQVASQKQIALELEPTDIPSNDSALLAAYVRLELSRFLSFEQAMSDPTYAIGIRNLADAIARQELAEQIAAIFANDQANYRLQFTQAFRAELRAAISARNEEAADAS